MDQPHGVMYSVDPAPLSMVVNHDPGETVNGYNCPVTSGMPFAGVPLTGITAAVAVAEVVMTPFTMAGVTATNTGDTVPTACSR